MKKNNNGEEKYNINVYYTQSDMNKKNNIKIGVVNCFQIKNYGSLFLSTCMNSPPCPVVGGTVCKLPSLSIPLTALTFPCCLSKTSSTSFSCPSAGGVILFAINNWNFSGYGNSPAQR